MAAIFKTIASLIKEVNILKLWIKNHNIIEQISTSSQGEMLDADERHMQDVTFILF